MKTLKAPRFSFLYKPFMQAGRVELIVTMFSFIPFNKPKEPMLEEEAWPAITAQLGDMPLDVGDFKATGEWLAYGSACAPLGEKVRNMDVSIAINNKPKILRVFGEREWDSVDGGPITQSEVIPFENIPITASFAYGGSEFSDNPAGCGHWPKNTKLDRYLLPSITYLGEEMQAPEDILTPGYFCGRDIMLPERQQYVGTYDQHWAENSFPGMPDDFDSNTYQLAQVDQQLETFFSGEEEFDISNMHPEHPEQSLRLPGIRGRVFITINRSGADQTFEEIPMVADTVSLFPSVEIAVVHQRGRIEVESMDFHEVKSMIGAFEWLSDNKRPIDYYRACRDERLDFEKVGEALLKVAELYPENWEEPPDKLLDIIKPRDPSLTSDGTPKLDAMWAKMKGVLDAGLTAQGLGSYDEMIKADPLKDENPKLKEIRKELEKVKGNMPKTAQELKDRGLGETRLKALVTSYVDNEANAAEAYFKKQCSFFGYDYNELKAKARLQTPKSIGAIKENINAELQRIANDADAPDAIRAAAKRASPSAFGDDFDDRVKHIKELETKQKSLQGHFLPVAVPLTPGANSDLREELSNYEGQKESGLGRDFRGADLSGLQLSGMDLTGGDFTSANLRGTDLRGANLGGACFAYADLTDALLESAYLPEANFGESIIDRTSFGGALMTQVNFTRAKGECALFVHSHLDESRFEEANLIAPEFMGCRLANTFFIETSIEGAWFNEATMDNTLFLNCEMQNSKFFKSTGSNTTIIGGDVSNGNFARSEFKSFITINNVKLDNSDFRRSKFTMANFRGSSLTKTDFSDSELNQSDFSETNLLNAKFVRAFARQCRFHRAEIGSVNFDGTDLMDSNFLLANLKNCSAVKANFFNVDFMKANISEVNFDDANLGRTRLEGFRFP